jgi:putative lipoic acid-binding regulatory protein
MPDTTPIEVSPIDYPVDFPIKVMGRNVPGFAQTVTGIVQRHAPDFDAASMEVRPSRKNTYLSLTCVVHARSREQLDGLYTELSGHPMVVMVL